MDKVTNKSTNIATDEKGFMDLAIKKNNGYGAKVKIRLAQPSDVGTILVFIRELADYEKCSEQVVATESQLHRTLFGPQAYAEVLLAEVEGEPVGFALFFHNYSTFLAKPGIYLEDLFIRPKARNHGVGRLLFEKLAQIAVNRGCGRLEWSVLDWNQLAIDFYEKMGAKPMSDWTTYRMTSENLKKIVQS